jgi:glutamate-1-semialdehyde 2,1-aminomutase
MPGGEEMETYKYSKGPALMARAEKVIPKGIYGHLGATYLIPNDAYPLFSERAQGAYFWDVDGNKFLDYMCGFGPNILGYNDPDVDAAAMEQIKKENCSTKPTEKMVELAELMVDTVDMADWSMFCKNGGDVTNLALLIARAATGRRKVILVKGSYHGVSPWMQSPGPGHAGIGPEDLTDNIYVDWNNADQVEQAIRDNPGQIACFMSTPYWHPVSVDNQMPANGYWQKIRKLCTDNGVVLAVDDVRCGFRMDIAGSDKNFGYKSDLLCFCKSLANCWTISALCGTDALKDAAKSVFYTGSYWLSAVPFAAAVACISKIKRVNAVQHMTGIGEKLTKGLVEVAKSHGHKLVASGHPSIFFIRHEMADPQAAPQFHRAFIAECVKRGVYLTSFHNMFTCYAMTDKDVEFSLAVADEAYKVLAKNFKAN